MDRLTDENHIKGRLNVMIDFRANNKLSQSYRLHLYSHVWMCSHDGHVSDCVSFGVGMLLGFDFAIALGQGGATLLDHGMIKTTLQQYTHPSVY